MANYSFVINSQFKPFSYAELLAPVHASTEAHQKVEDEYSALSSQAETLRARAEQEAIANPNSQWVKRYNDYANKLEQSASDLAQHGLQPGVRQQIREAKKDYFNSVDPAVKAIAQQQKLSDAQYAQNPALRMVYGDMPTVDQLIGDMTLKPVAYSGQDIYTQAMTSSKAASARNVVNEFMKDPQFAGYIRQVKAAGYDAKTIDDMLKIPELKGVVDMVKNQFGGFDGVSEKNQKKLEGEVLKGLFDGVGYNREEQLIYNQTEAQQRQFAHDVQMEKMRESFQAAEAQQAQIQTARASIVPQNIYSQKERTAAANEIAQYKKYFYKDESGRWKMTYAGWKEYNRKNSKTTGDTYQTPEGVTTLTNVRTTYTPSAFKQFVDKMNGGKAWSKGWQPGNLGNLYARYCATNSGSQYDATKLTEYAYNIDSSDQDNWAQRVAEQAGGKLYTTDWDNKSKSWKRGSSVDIADAFKDNGKVSSVQYSAYGLTFKITDKNGKSTRYSLPAGINPRNSDNAIATLQHLGKIQELYNKASSTGSVSLTNDQKQALVNAGMYQSVSAVPNSVNTATLQYAASQLESNAMMYMSQLGNTNTNKAQEWSAMGY